MTPFRLAVLLALLGAGVTVACTTAPTDDRFVATPPDRASFPAVADMLVRRCGTLDCHGMTARNLRVFGQGGLREAEDARPNAFTDKTTVAEYDEDYASVVGLEPELISQVVADHGANPDRLTLIRKARGTEHHKGLTIFTEGSCGDVCLTSWLAGKVNADDCTGAISDPFPACTPK
jgi:hypothetical protein